jgi:bifunctional DNase/RNase
VRGISGSPDKQGVYVLMLGKQGYPQVFPVVIGFYEAQSIAFCLEEYLPEYPFVHDLFFQLAKKCNIEVLEIFIKDFQNSKFQVEILCFDGRNHTTFNSRISDAVALSLRFRCPIFTTAEVFSMVGANVSANNKSALGHFSLEELMFKLDEAVKDEDYEKAIVLRNEIKKRKNDAC